MAGLTGMGHVAIYSKDLEQTLSFYRKLGCPEIFRMDYADGSLFYVYLKVTDTHYIEVFPSDGPVGEQHKSTPGIHHFCLTVDDVDAFVAELEQKGLPLVREVKVGTAGCRQGWINDPDGNQIEIMEMLPNCRAHEGVDRQRQGLSPLHLSSSWPKP